MNLTEFTKYLFDRSVDGLEWYFRDDHEDLRLAADSRVELTSEVFRGIADIDVQFSEKQVCMGLRYLVRPSCGPMAYLCLDLRFPHVLCR